MRGNGIYVDSESTYVDTGCWPELKHSAGLGFRNACQDLISTVRD
ncbi:7139_t:CDS:2 [Rhizophagus irregularis]|nr:7139_t:CDS:2 [Rhizophagus irregularis]